MKKLIIIAAVLLVCCGLYAMVNFSMSQSQNTNNPVEEAQIEEQADVSDSDDTDLADSSTFKPSEPIAPKSELSKEEQQRQMIEYFEKVRQEIFQGREFNDQSTPSNIFLTFISALYQEDWELFWQIRGVEKPVGPFGGMNPEAREHMLRLFKEKMTISLIPVVNKSPQESELYAIYTGELPDKEMAQVWTFGYIKGAWRWLGSSSEIDNWRASAEQGEARRRNRIIGK